MEESEENKGKPEDRGKQSSPGQGVPERAPGSSDGATMMDAPAPTPPRNSSQPEPNPDITFVDGPTTPPAPKRRLSAAGRL